MTSQWRHPPGTLRALLATFKSQYVICRACRRYVPLRVEYKDLDRKYDPCPFRCTLCQQRGAIVFDVPAGFGLVRGEPAAHSPKF